MLGSDSQYLNLIRQICNLPFLFLRRIKASIAYTQPIIGDLVEGSLILVVGIGCLGEFSIQAVQM
jgi:hypothetical protein